MKITKGSREKIRVLGGKTLGDPPKDCETRNEGQIWTHRALVSQTKVV